MLFIEWKSSYFDSNFTKFNACLIDNDSALVQVMAWHQIGDKLSLKPIMMNIVLLGNNELFFIICRFTYGYTQLLISTYAVSFLQDYSNKCRDLERELKSQQIDKAKLETANKVRIFSWYLFILQSISSEGKWWVVKCLICFCVLFHLSVLLTYNLVNTISEKLGCTCRWRGTSQQYLCC